MSNEAPFGREVRSRRRQLDLTQEELAMRVGCATITVRKIEAGAMRPSHQIAVRLAAALDVASAEQADFVQAARAVYVETRADSQPSQGSAAGALIERNDPYKGLRSFGEDDAAIFFGRETLVRHLLARMVEPTELVRFLAIVGPSGSGKSSLVQAGLLSALRRGELPGAAAWSIVAIVPGSDPLTELATALCQIAASDVEANELRALLSSDSYGLLHAAQAVLPADPAIELLLVIDQFEELFTLCPDPATRTLLLESIIIATLDERSRLRIIIVLRADFVDRPLHYVDFGELFRQRSELVLPLTADELERAIVGPARWAGLTIEEGLTAAISLEIGNQPGGLPLLQHALSELYVRRQGTLLTRAAYAEIGGVAGALTASAEALYHQLEPPDQEAAQRILLMLVMPGEGSEDTRRRVRRTDLDAVGSSAVVDQILESFSQARLLTFDHDPLTHAPTVEVAHEALLRAWPRLRSWIDASREQLLAQRRLAVAAAEWAAAAHDDSFLASGARLTGFATLAEQAAFSLNSDEQAYLDASLVERARQEEHERERQQRELQQARQGVVRLRWLAAALVGMLLAAFVLAGVAYQQQQAAQSNALIAQGQALASAAQAVFAEGNLDQARALALAAVEAAKPAPEAQALLAQAAYAPGTYRLLTGHSDAVMGVAISADGQLALSGSSDRTLRLWQLPAGVELRRLSGLVTNIWASTLSPDGHYALAAGQDHLLYVWDLAHDEPPRHLAGHSDEITSVAVSPDSTLALTGSTDKTIRLWDLASGKEIRRFTGHSDGVWAVAFSPNGSYALSGSADNSMRLWDLANGREIRRFVGHSNRIRSVAFSHNGKLAASGSWDETARLWDLANGKELQLLKPHEGSVSALAFSPDDEQLASASGAAIYLWDRTSGRERQHFREHRDEVFALAFSPDGRFILSGSRDSTLRLWDTHNGAEQRRFVGHTGWVRSVAISSDGRTALSGSWDWTVRLWDIASGREVRQFVGDRTGVEAVALSPEGSRALSSSNDGTLHVWEIASGRLLQNFVGHTSYVWKIAISPDSSRALSASADGTARLWDLSNGRELRRFSGHNGAITSVAFSPDSASALSGGSDGMLILWDVANGSERQHFVGHSGGITSVAFSPDGTTVLSGSLDGTARLWDVASGRDLHRFPSQTNPIQSVAISPDGRRALFTSGLGTLALWDVASGQELRRFDLGGALTFSAVFSPDGRSVLAGTTDTMLHLWHIDELPALIAYAHDQRYLPELNCEQRQRYHLQPPCTPDQK